MCDAPLPVGAPACFLSAGTIVSRWRGEGHGGFPGQRQAPLGPTAGPTRTSGATCSSPAARWATAALATMLRRARLVPWWPTVPIAGGEALVALHYMVLDERGDLTAMVSRRTPRDRRSRLRDPAREGATPGLKRRRWSREALAGRWSHILGTCLLQASHARTVRRTASPIGPGRGTRHSAASSWAGRPAGSTSAGRRSASDAARPSNRQQGTAATARPPDGPPHHAPANLGAVGGESRSWPTVGLGAPTCSAWSLVAANEVLLGRERALAEPPSPVDDPSEPRSGGSTRTQSSTLAR